MSDVIEQHEDLPVWLEPLRDASAKKHRASGIKVRPAEPCLSKPTPSPCAVHPEKIRFTTLEAATAYRVGRNREWLLRTEPYPCSCKGFHFRTKRRGEQ